MRNFFDRSGLASLEDLDHVEYKIFFEKIEIVQRQFSELEDQFRSSTYKWPKDSLHCWSRCWEYPYVLHHLKKYKEDRKEIIVDIGCGVTFFPFCIAREGFDVIGVDIDPIVELDLLKAATIVPSLPASISFRSTDGETLPFAESEVDKIYCISVLEHIPDPSKTIDEFARVLKKGGILILTIDIDLEGNFDIGPQKFLSLRDVLQKYFEWREHETTIHPIRILRSNNGPYPLYSIKGTGKLSRYIKDVVRHLLGRERTVRYNLACYGAVFIRK